jgi:hypothetical protein
VEEGRLREIPGVGDARLLVHTRTDHGANPNFARSPPRGRAVAVSLVVRGPRRDPDFENLDFVDTMWTQQ